MVLRCCELIDDPLLPMLPRRGWSEASKPEQENHDRQLWYPQASSPEMKATRQKRRKRQEKERKERKRENLTPAVATRANYRVFVAIRGHEHYKTSPMPWSLISDKVFRLASLCDLHHRGGIPCVAKANKGRKRRAKATPRQRVLPRFACAGAHWSQLVTYS